MKLLFDQNLSQRLVERLQDVYPDSLHVRQASLDRAPDEDVWTYAATHRYVIVSKDSDFHQRSLVDGFPPKVVWVQRGNCSTADIEALLRSRVEDVRSFLAHPDAAFLELS